MTLLQPAINLGLPEKEFWDMTRAEVERYIEGATWRMKRKAQLDYRLADLIGISVSRILSKDAEYPNLYDAYPEYFEEEKRHEEEEKVRQQTVNSVNNFMAMAQRINSKSKKGVEKQNG